MTKDVKEVDKFCEVCQISICKQRITQPIKDFKPEIGEFSVDISFFCRSIFFHLTHLESRYVWGCMIKSKKSSEVASSMEKFLKEISIPIESILSDNGGEFKGIFKKLCDSENILKKETLT